MHQSTISVEPGPIHMLGQSPQRTNPTLNLSWRKTGQSQSWGKQERPAVLALPKGPQKLPEDGKGDKGEVSHSKLGRVSGRSKMDRLFQLSCCCLVRMLGQEEAVIWQPGLALLLLTMVLGQGGDSGVCHLLILQSTPGNAQDIIPCTCCLGTSPDPSRLWWSVSVLLFSKRWSNLW